jgi:hypothetical protein
VLLLVVAAGVELAQVLRQTRGALIGAVVVAAVQVTMVDQGVVAVVRAVPDQVPLAVQGVPAVKVIQAVRVAGVALRVAMVVQLAVQIHALVAPVVLRATISSVIRL